MATRRETVTSKVIRFSLAALAVVSVLIGLAVLGAVNMHSVAPQIVYLPGQQTPAPAPVLVSQPVAVQQPVFVPAPAPPVLSAPVPVYAPVPQPMVIEAQPSKTAIIAETIATVGMVAILANAQHRFSYGYGNGYRFRAGVYGRNPFGVQVANRGRRR